MRGHEHQAEESRPRLKNKETSTQTNQVVSFIMLFILTIGYIDKVYKSVSSKRKPTHPSVGNVFFVVYVCEPDRDAGSPLLFAPSSRLPFTPLHLSEQQWTPSSQCTVQGEDIFLYLPVFVALKQNL